MKHTILALAMITIATPVFAQANVSAAQTAADARAAQNREKNADTLDSQADARARRNTYDRVHATQIHEAAEDRAAANREKNAGLLDAQARARRNTHNRVRAADDAKDHASAANSSTPH